MVSDSSQRPRTSRGGTAVITTSMPLTSAYSRQNISDEMNIYVHPEPKLPHGIHHLKFICIAYYNLVMPNFFSLTATILEFCV